MNVPYSKMVTQSTGARYIHDAKVNMDLRYHTFEFLYIIISSKMISLIPYPQFVYPNSYSERKNFKRKFKIKKEGT